MLPADVRHALSDHADGVVVAVWAVPGASRSGVSGMHDGAVRVRVAAPAEGGKANAAIAKILERHLAASRVRLLGGATSRRKRFLAAGVTTAEAVQRLAD